MFQELVSTSSCLIPQIPQFANTRPEQISINIWRTSHQRYLDLMCRGLEMPHLQQHRWHSQFSIYKLVRGKKQMMKLEPRLKNSVKTMAIWWMVISHGTAGTGKTKPAAISKICDGHLTPLLIFTSSDGWNAIWGRKKKDRIKEKEKPSLGSCYRKLLLATICSSTRFFSSLCQPSEPPLENRAGSPNE